MSHRPRTASSSAVARRAESGTTMNAELPSPATIEATARPRELWPAATLGTMMLLIVLLGVHLVVISARLGAATDETYADGTGVVATLSVAGIATGSE